MQNMRHSSGIWQHTTQQCTLHCKLTRKECEDPTIIVQSANEPCNQLLWMYAVAGLTLAVTCYIYSYMCSANVGDLTGLMCYAPIAVHSVSLNIIYY